MQKRMVAAAAGPTSEDADPTEPGAAGRDVLHGFRVTAHHALMAAGIAAIAALGGMFIKPDLADHVKALSPFWDATSGQGTLQAMPPMSALLAPAMQAAAAPAAHSFLTLAPGAAGQVAAHAFSPPVAQTAATPAGIHPLLAPAPLPPAGAGPAPAPAPAVHPVAAGLPSSPAAGGAHGEAGLQHAGGAPREQKWVSNWLARRYRVASDAAHVFVSAAYATAREIKFDPLLILAVMAIESGLNPFAESPVGAQGLMQVMSKIHHEKFQPLGGLQAALNPIANIKVGAAILQEYVRRGGSVEAGLKMYVGAGALSTDSGYGSKVLAEYRRLKDVASGKKVSVTASNKPAPKPAPAQEAKSATEATPEKMDRLAAWKPEVNAPLESSGY